MHRHLSIRNTRVVNSNNTELYTSKVFLRTNSPFRITRLVVPVSLQSQSYYGRLLGNLFASILLFQWTMPILQVGRGWTTTTRIGRRIIGEYIESWKQGRGSASDRKASNSER